MAFKVDRLMDSSGRIPEPPSPAYVVRTITGDQESRVYITADDLEEIVKAALASGWRKYDF